MKNEQKVFASNRKASFDYEIVEKFEAGIELTGYEVKLVRAGKISLAEAFVSLKKEAFLKQAHIAVEEGNQAANFFRTAPDGDREKRLLLHKKQIRKLQEAVTREGMTVVPLSIYANDKGLIKVSIALAKGKKNFDKRESLKKKTQEREMQQALKSGR